MEENFLDKRKIVTMAKDLKEAAGTMVYPKENDFVDLSSFYIIKDFPKKEDIIFEIPLPEVKEELPVKEEVEEKLPVEEDEKEGRLPSAIELGLEEPEEELEEKRISRETTK